MALSLKEKETVVEEVHRIAGDALSLVVADARGVSSNSMNSLRRDAYDAKVVLRVVKNTLAKRALKNTGFDCVGEKLSGPALFGFSMEEPGSAARLFRSFVKAEERFEVKMLSLGGELWDAAYLDKLATIPTREEALAQVAATLRAPVAGLARALNGVVTRLARVTAAVAESRSGEG